MCYRYYGFACSVVVNPGQEAEWGLSVEGLKFWNKVKIKQFLISSFRRVLYVLCFLLGNSPVSEFYIPTFRNTLSVPSSLFTYLPWQMEQTECSETSAYKIQASGNYPEENTQHKAIPLQAWTRPWGFQEVEAPRFQDNRHMKVVRLSALRTGLLYSPRKYCW